MKGLREESLGLMDKNLGLIVSIQSENPNSIHERMKLDEDEDEIRENFILKVAS